MLKFVLLLFAPEFHSQYKRPSPTYTELVNLEKKEVRPYSIWLMLQIVWLTVKYE